MLRVHFTAEDLLNVRFAAAPAPLLEWGLVMTLLRAREPDALFARWRHSLRGALPDRARFLFELFPEDTLGPVFLDPPLPDLADAVELVAAAPRHLVEREMHRLHPRQRALGPLGAGLLHRDARAWRHLVGALPVAVASLGTPHWPRIRHGFDADVSWRGALLAEQGLKPVLAGLSPGGHWHGSTLHLPSPLPRDLHLNGAGLTLYPSALWRGPVAHCEHPDGSRLLLYPALTPLPLIKNADAADPLSALLGPTRAEILQLLTRPHSTTGLARALGVSPATASAHAKTLREAGLVVTVRDGKEVRHACTTLGARLLAQPPAAR
jgi:DNA-binding transcriptional ArsR family regulator